MLRPPTPAPSAVQCEARAPPNIQLPAPTYSSRRLTRGAPRQCLRHPRGPCRLRPDGCSPGQEASGAVASRVGVPAGHRVTSAAAVARNAGEGWVGTRSTPQGEGWAQPPPPWGDSEGRTLDPSRTRGGTPSDHQEGGGADADIDFSPLRLANAVQPTTQLQLPRQRIVGVARTTSGCMGKGGRDIGRGRSDFGKRRAPSNRGSLGLGNRARWVAEALSIQHGQWPLFSAPR